MGPWRKRARSDEGAHLVDAVDVGAAWKTVARALEAIGFCAQERPFDVMRPHVLRRQLALARRAVLGVLLAEVLVAKRAEVPVDVAELLDPLRQDARYELHADPAHLRLFLATHP